MGSIDDTDRAILQELLANGRRPFRQIADDVGVSGPTVSDRVERLSRAGIVDGITLELDRSTLDAGTEIMLEVHVRSVETTDVRRSLSELPEVDRVFETADNRFYAQAYIRDRDVTALLSAAVDLEHVDDYEVRLLDDSIHCPSVPDDRASAAYTGRVDGPNR